MDLEEQILRYYLKLFSILIILILFLIFLYSFYVINKNITFEKNTFQIYKGEKIEQVLTKNITNFNKVEYYIASNYYKINNFLLDKFVHYGYFNIEQNITLNKFLKIITKPSNVYDKITIVEGWSREDLQKELKKYFEDIYYIPYEDIIADTYFIKKNIDFKSFVKYLKKIKNEYFKKNQNNEITSSFLDNEIMVIGSLIEKEGLDYNDKKNISSVIFNRLNTNMKLQIDATVLFAITDGEYNLNRELLLKDLKIIHPFNTYHIRGLPPKPISYVGKRTLDIVFENYKSDFLFYFFNNSLKKHIFSKTFEEHKLKLNEYRSIK